MKTLKNKCGLLLALITLAACKPGNISFTNNDIDGDFFTRIIHKEIQRGHITGTVSQVHCYRATFKEVMVERDDIIEWSLISTKSATPVVDYLQGNAKRIDLYLLELKGADGSDKGFIYYSLKFEQTPVAGAWQDNCQGFGKAYYGTHDKQNIIRFHQELKTARSNHKYVLKNKGDATYYFVVDYNAQKEIDVRKVVNTGYNKISGNKDLVYNIDTVFNDPTAMNFEFERTITIP